MKKVIQSYLKIAGEIALKGQKRRSFYVGAVAVRNDGAIVYAFNGPTRYPVKEVHAEYRISKKLDVGSIVYIARIKANGDFAMAKPCKTCAKALRSKGVKRAYYTTDDNFDYMDFK